MRRALAIAVAVPALLIGVTWWALESGGVAELRTQKPDGGSRSTHVWFVEEEGAIWIEAASERSGWYRDILSTPALTLTRESEGRHWVARPSDEPGRREALRAALRAKYGFRDWWVAWLVDASRSIPVRLEPAPSSP